MMNDEHFINKFNTNQLHKSKIDKLSDEEKYYLEHRYSDIFRSYKETIWRIINKIDILPKCPECGNYVKIRYRKEKLYYHTCGSPECIYKRKGNGPKEACIKKYDCINQFQREEVKEKIKQHHLKKYGHISHTQNKEWKENEIKRNLEKYGCINQFQREEVKEKIKQHNLKKYGVEHYFQSEEGKLKLSKITSSIEFQNKRNSTLQKNKTWKSSKDEEYIYSELIKYFKDVKRQYQSDEYPFACDFYINDINLYIEYNGSDLHNFRPFTNSKEDKYELKKLLEKSDKLKNKTGKFKTRYDNRIYTWTDLDVRKRKIAYENNLNFIELWNLNEFNLYLKTII